jgi:hypothetical protein
LSTASAAYITHCSVKYMDCILYQSIRSTQNLQRDSAIELYYHALPIYIILYVKTNIPHVTFKLMYYHDSLTMRPKEKQKQIAKKNKFSE